GGFFMPGRKHNHLLKERAMASIRQYNVYKQTEPFREAKLLQLILHRPLSLYLPLGAFDVESIS
ncbi:hypothetical protein, partial [Pseudomonas agarici]|uniref:hypothetical protein n=1 Tax=Pseudomonas agarici TaxID=46677 RepID=UPI001ABFF345